MKRHQNAGMLPCIQIEPALLRELSALFQNELLQGLAYFEEDPLFSDVGSAVGDAFHATGPKLSDLFRYDA